MQTGYHQLASSSMLEMVQVIFMNLVAAWISVMRMVVSYNLFLALGSSFFNISAGNWIKEFVFTGAGSWYIYYYKIVIHN